MRAAVSVGPPGGKATVSLISLSGHWLWARAAGASVAMAVAQAAERIWRREAWKGVEVICLLKREGVEMRAVERSGWERLRALR